MNDLLDELSPTLTEMLSEVVREIGMRERMYPKWVASGKMKQSQADRHLRVMRAVADKLRELSSCGTS